MLRKQARKTLHRKVMEMKNAGMSDEQIKGRRRLLEQDVPSNDGVRDYCARRGAILGARRCCGQEKTVERVSMFRLAGGARRAAGRDYFTDPSVRPRTMNRWPRNISRIAGIVEMTDAAAICACCTSYCCAKRAMRPEPSRFRATSG